MIVFPLKRFRIPLIAFTAAVLNLSCALGVEDSEMLAIDREDYREGFEGFWLGQCIANWTGINAGNGQSGTSILYRRFPGEGRMS